MSKSVLVIETPKACDSCPLYQWVDITVSGLPYPVGSGWCGAGDKNADILYLCPLKPMPKKMDETEYMQKVNSNGDWYEQVVGWNACLDEIEGETE